MNQSPHRIIAIVGPTAVGKTSLAIAVATHLQVPIISFDSRQCYSELNIGVARPSAEQLQQAPHHFIADHSVLSTVNAAYYEQYATQKVAELTARYGQVVMVGGTGLYWKAFWEGLDEIPDIAPSIRSGIMAAYEKEGIGWLQRALATEDPRFAATGEMRNPQRMMRALEVMRSTQKSILTFRRGQVKRQPYELVAIGLQLPRHELYLRIDQRVDKMMSDGWLSEVESLIKYKDLNALNTVGYKELFQYLQKDISLQEAIALIKQNTRQYAKRQMTWFTKDPHFRWFSPAQEKELISSL